MSGAMVITLNDGTTQTIDADNFRGLLTELGTLIAIECQKARREQAAKDAAIVERFKGGVQYASDDELLDAIIEEINL